MTLSWTLPPQESIFSNKQITTPSLTPWLQKLHHTQPSAYLAIWGILNASSNQNLAPLAAVLTDTKNTILPNWTRKETLVHFG